MILAQGQVALALPAVAAHQAAMGILPAIVLGQDFPAEMDARCISFLLQIVSTQAIQDDEVAILQALPAGDEPILVQILFQKIALV